MPKNTQLKSWSTQQCKQSCQNQRNACTTFNSGTPNPRTAYQLQRCHTAYNDCVKNCTSNNIRPGGR